MNSNKPLTIETEIPPSTNNAYVNSSRGRVLSAVARAFKDATGWQALILARQLRWRYQQGHRIGIKIDLYFKDDRRRDIDNCAKLVIDAIAQALGFDDCIVDDLHIRRRPPDKQNPRCVVKVEQYEVRHVDD